jgi:hypothetical protein
MSTNGNGEVIDPKEPPQTDPPIAAGENLPSEEITPGLIGPPIHIQPVAVDDAKVLLRNYQATAVTPVVPVKGVYLDRSQFEAMKQLVADDPNLPGFRIFFGKETTGVNVGIVVGVDGNNTDQVTKRMFKTDSAKTGPCPPVCDKNSPIKEDMG